MSSALLSTLSIDAVIARLTTLKAQRAEQGESLCVVATNGCFDLLHVGHLRYLHAARQQGDVLIVGLNSDASVQRLKGPTRPILPEAERAELLLGLDCVDDVFVFDAPSPVDALVALAPSIYVKGGDYAVDTLPEGRALQAIGTKLVFFPYVEGRSTSSIVQRIQSLPPV